MTTTENILVALALIYFCIGIILSVRKYVTSVRFEEDETIQALFTVLLVFNVLLWPAALCFKSGENEDDEEEKSDFSEQNACSNCRYMRIDFEGRKWCMHRRFTAQDPVYGKPLHEVECCPEVNEEVEGL